MTILLQFDMFHTIIRVPNIFSDIEALDDEFSSWVWDVDECLRKFDDGTYVCFFDDKTFIKWLKNVKSVNAEDIEIIVSHESGWYDDDSIKLDAVMHF